MIGIWQTRDSRSGICDESSVTGWRSGDEGCTGSVAKEDGGNHGEAARACGKQVASARGRVSPSPSTPREDGSPARNGMSSDAHVEAMQEQGRSRRRSRRCCEWRDGRAGEDKDERKGRRGWVVRADLSKSAPSPGTSNKGMRHERGRSLEGSYGRPTGGWGRLVRPRCYRSVVGASRGPGLMTREQAGVLVPHA